MKNLLWAVGVFATVIGIALVVRFVGNGGDKVLEIEFQGSIVETTGSDLLATLSGDTRQSVHTITSNIRRAADDPSIKGIFFHIGSVEIGLAQLQDIADAMAVFKKSGKWSVSYLDTAGEFSSGNIAFSLASTTDHITVSPTGYVNLVGLRTESPFFKGTLEMLDVDVLVEQRQEYKNAAAPFNATKYSDAHREAVSALLEDIQSMLIHHLVTHRGLEQAVARSWFEKGPYNVVEAREKGLIHTVGYYDQVLDDLDQRMGGEAETISLEIYQEGGKLYDGTVPVAVIIAERSIHRGESTSDPTIGSDTITRAIRNAREDGVEGILLRVDSPGGSVIASDLIRREIELTRQAGIPVVVSMGNLAASGGYYISMDADYIVAQPGTITGSIGVIAVLTSLHRSLKENLKMTFDSYQTMENGDFFAGSKLPEGERLRRLQESIDFIYNDFTQKVAKGRKMELEKVQEIAKGRVWSGIAAHQHGLVDELGDVHLAMTRLQERMKVLDTNDIKLEVYPQSDSPLAIIQALLGARTAIPREVKTTLDAWETLSNPGQNMLRLPIVPTIE